MNMRTETTGPFSAPAQELGWDNPPWEAAALRVLFVRLSPWRDVQRSSPHLFLYSLMRNTLGQRAFGDFVFLPSRYERKALDADHSPWMRGIASGKGATEFDAILVSCAYALELVNLPVLLAKSDIPLRASQRRTGWPLVLVGGSNALANQGLIFKDGDSFADGFFFGEAEAVPGGAELFSLLAALRGQDRGEILAVLEKELPAFWAFGHSLTPTQETALNTFRVIHPARSIVQQHPFLPEAYPLLNSQEASTGRLQISWGCPAFCTFCFEGWERKPYREVPRDRIVDMAKNLIRNTGISTLELYSFNFNAHSDILSLLLDLNRMFDRVNMMSQRADILVNTPGMLECELAGEKRSFTIGVEGISAGMRALYKKGLSSGDLWRLIERLYKEKTREIKFFYIISGFETDADLEEFTQFCQRLQQLSEQHRPSPRLLFSAGYLVRMPFTPLRYAPLEFNREKLEGLSSQIQKAVETAGFEYRLAMDWEEYLADQMLVLGDYRLAEALETAAQKGILYDDGIRGDLLGIMTRFFSLDIQPGGTLLSEKTSEYDFPLSFIHHAIPGSFLYKTYKEALERQEAPICFKDSEEATHCMACGACRDQSERALLTEHRIAGDPAQVKAKLLAEIIRAKRRTRPRYVKVFLGKEYGGAFPEYLSALLLRKVLTEKPELTGRIFRISEALWTSPDWNERIGWGFSGETVLALYGCNFNNLSSDSPIMDDETYDEVLESLSDLQAQAFETELERLYPQEIELTLPSMEYNGALSLCRKWLASLRVACTERKGSLPNQRIFEISPKDKKKRILSEVQVLSEATHESRLLITGGPKFSINDLLPAEEDRFSVSFHIKKLGTL